jgi:hypothetical protein
MVHYDRLPVPGSTWPVGRFVPLAWLGAQGTCPFPPSLFNGVSFWRIAALSRLFLSACSSDTGVLPTNALLELVLVAWGAITLDLALVAHESFLADCR